MAYYFPISPFRKHVNGANSMSHAVKKIEEEVATLSETELRDFRIWFAEFDSARWDAQLTHDVKTGKLDGLAAEAFEQYGKGRCKPL
jgi:hypothetical protein